MENQVDGLTTLLRFTGLAISPGLEILFWFCIVIALGVFLWNKGRFSISLKR